MIALSFSRIDKRYDEQILFDNLSFSVNQGDKLALIGKNGTGKTTILRLICGLEQPDGGDFYVAKNLVVGYMRQADIDRDISLLDYALEAFESLIETENKLHQMERQMGEFKTHDATFDAFMHDYHELAEQFKDDGGYLFRSKAKGILIGLGFAEEQHARSVLSLSGGQLARIKLARLLIDEPDILLLDEPTNHLDISTTGWLENHLKQYSKTLVIVSHDRYFLDAVCNKTAEIENRQIMMYNGNYSSFRIKKEAAIKQMNKAYQQYQKERKRQEEIIRRYKARGTELLAKRAKSREKMLQKMARPDTFQQSNKQMKLNLKSAVNSGGDVLQIEEVSKSYGVHTVLNDITFAVRRGEKIGLIGDNGSGKTTLLKIITGELEQDGGFVDYGHRVIPAYYDQKQENLSPNLTIVEEIHNMIPTMNEGDVRAILGRFLFSDEEVFKPISVLSGGEKARVLLTKLFLTESNLLLLDEPTNHLDLYSKEVLEQSLVDYDGTILVISHDRYFLNKVCNKIIALQDGRITEYLGDYNYYLEKQAALKHPVAEETVEVNKTALKQNRKMERKRINEKKKLQAAIADCEVQISTIETRLEEIDGALCLEEVYSDSAKVKALVAEQSDLKAKLDEAFSEWEVFSEDFDKY